MAVVPMKKVLICGLKQNRKAILDFLQCRKVLEISGDLPEDAVLQKTDVSSRKILFERNAGSARQALEVLEQYAPGEVGMLSSFAGRKPLTFEEYEAGAVDHETVIADALRLQELANSIGESRSRIPKLEQQMEALSPWQSFDLPLDFAGTKMSAAFIGSLAEPLTAEEVTACLRTFAPEAETVDVTVVSSSREQTCLFAVCARAEADAVEEALGRMGFARAPLTSVVPAKRSEQLRAELAAEKEKIEECRRQICDMATEREKLKFAMDYNTMRAETYEVLGGLLQSRRVFFITGYVPADKAEVLKAALDERYGAFTDISDPGEDEDVPVLLHNNAFSAPVEGVIESYSLPGRGEVDPSMIVALFYYMFFGLMLSDAGYGLIIVAGSVYCLHRFKNMEENLKKSLKMFLYSGITAMFWGVMFGSFFGDAVSVIATTFFGRPDISLKPLWFEPVNMPMKLLVFSFLLGIIHLFTGLGVRLYTCLRSGRIMDAVCDVFFWYMLVGGAILCLLTVEMLTNIMGLRFTLPAPVGTVAGVVAVGGAIGIVLTSGRSSRSWGKRLLKGLYGLYGISNYLSDILSYSRLLALGLATSVISTVLNQLGSMMGNSIPGVILFILIFVFGHSLNLAINALGAYVHTNRLQYVEFFGKFYNGGGRMFAPFGIHTKYYKVKEEI